MAGAGTITKLTRPEAAEFFYLAASHFVLIVTEQTPTGPKEIARFTHETGKAATAKAFEAIEHGFGAEVVEVWAR